MKKRLKPKHNQLRQKMKNNFRVPTANEKLPRKKKKEFIKHNSSGLYSYCRLRNNLENNFSKNCEIGCDAFKQLSKITSPEEKKLLDYIDFSEIGDVLNAARIKMATKLEQNLPNIGADIVPTSGLSMTITINNISWQKK